ncbi:GAF domain-containing protein [Comamonadaceae bacterium OTU4NAUVB1]|jgi:GAF domain-containing protein|nr:GAF domain-containing protein [Comamonadaceae bacterium OTU4NAUVB1]
MPNARHLSDQELIDISHHWRRLALAGDASARDEARRHEVELRRRLGVPDPSEALLQASSGGARNAEREAGLPLAAADIASQFIIATADASTRSAEALQDLLHNLRILLDMDIAFVAEFVEGRKVYRRIDHAQGDAFAVKAGDSAPLESTLCQRVVDGRLPSQLGDTSTEPMLSTLAVQKALNIGAYLSAPVVLRDGSVYGTLCCISHSTRTALGSRQIDALRYVAGIVAAELDKHRG